MGLCPITVLIYSINWLFRSKS